MLRRLRNLLISLALLAVCLLIVMGGWVVCDGLMDQIDHADLAMVPGHGHVLANKPDDLLKTQLDRTIQLYQQHDFPLVVVCGGVASDGSDEAAVMGQYLIDGGLPPDAIVEDHQGTSAEQASRHTAEFMVSRQLETALVLAPYYRVTRLKMALKHAGISSISQAHVGLFNKGDLIEIGRESLEVYYYMGRYYFYPAARVVAREMQNEAEVLKSQAADKMNSIDK